MNDIAAHSTFTWDGLGDIRGGRGDLGEDVPVLVYRLMQYTMLDVMARHLGIEEANALFRRSGHLAGIEFSRHVLNLSLDFNGFVADLQKKLKELKIGILRMEEYDPATGALVLTVEQDLDCSGLPVTGESVCTYDEGFIAGVFEGYSGRPYDVREIDCWALGDRACRFRGVVVGEKEPI